jgi:diguanylate cyclase (GGDEF)-like protein
MPTGGKLVGGGMLGLSAYDYVVKRHGAVLARFLEEVGSVAVAVIDDELRVIACNPQFSGLAAPEDVDGMQFTEFVEPVQGESVNLPPPGEYWQLTLRFSEGADGAQRFHVFSHRGEYVLFSDGTGGRPDRAAETMARVNQEMTNLNRKLRKRTRSLQRAKDTIEKLARTDELTGLANRRSVREELDRMVSEVRRHGFPLAVAMADLDHFKSINDQYGHDMGDAVLKGFAEILKSCCRKEDLPARWGGEEFIIFMPHTSAAECQEAAERMRRQLQNIDIPGIDQRMTVSFGVTELQPPENGEEAIKRADEALYDAKEGGRNQVVVKTPENV